GSGAYKLVSVMSGKALDNGNTAAEGAAVVQWTDTGGLPQRWRLIRLA
ncbi:RICIN domain-containing protein, partial [Nonomuraea insulae]